MKCKWKVAALIIGLVLCTSGMVSASEADALDALEEINGFQIQMVENLHEIKMTVSDLRYYSAVEEMGGTVDNTTFLQLRRTLDVLVTSGLTLVDRIDSNTLDGLSRALTRSKGNPTWTRIAKQYRNLSLHADAMHEALEYISTLGDRISYAEKSAIDALIEVVRIASNMSSIGIRY